jgi:hypothetical protein
MPLDFYVKASPTERNNGIADGSQRQQAMPATEQGLVSPFKLEKHGPPTDSLESAVGCTRTFRGLGKHDHFPAVSRHPKLNVRFGAIFQAIGDGEILRLIDWLRMAPKQRDRLLPSTTNGLRCAKF